MPRTTWPASAGSTASKKSRPAAGGRRGVDPITMSPVAAIVTVPSGACLRSAGAAARRLAHPAELPWQRLRRPSIEGREDPRQHQHDAAGAEQEAERAHSVTDYRSPARNPSRWCLIGVVLVKTVFTAW